MIDYEDSMSFLRSKNDETIKDNTNKDIDSESNSGTQHEEQSSTDMDIEVNASNWEKDLTSNHEKNVYQNMHDDRKTSSVLDGEVIDKQPKIDVSIMKDDEKSIKKLQGVILRTMSPMNLLLMMFFLIQD